MRNHPQRIRSFCYLQKQKTHYQVGLVVTCLQDGSQIRFLLERLKWNMVHALVFG